MANYSMQMMADSDGEGSASPVSALRVLLVEDEADTAESFRKLIQNFGYEVEVVHNGPDALFSGLKFRPDVVLLDIGLPFMNGFEVARKIRERFWGRSAYIIATTSWDSDEDKRLSKAAGIDVHMVKPIDLAELARLLSARENLAED